MDPNCFELIAQIECCCREFEVKSVLMVRAEDVSIVLLDLLLPWWGIPSRTI